MFGIVVDELLGLFGLFLFLGGGKVLVVWNWRFVRRVVIFVCRSIVCEVVSMLENMWVYLFKYF